MWDLNYVFGYIQAGIIPQMNVFRYHSWNSEWKFFPWDFGISEFAGGAEVGKKGEEASWLIADGHVDVTSIDGSLNFKRNWTEHVSIILAVCFSPLPALVAAQYAPSAETWWADWQTPALLLGLTIAVSIPPEETEF